MIQHLLKATLDALPDGVLIVDGDRQVVYCNETFERMWGIPADLIDEGKSRQLVTFVLEQLQDGLSFARDVERIYRTDQPSRDEVRLKDGRVFVRRSVCFDGFDRSNTRIWIFTDVTEVKKLQRDSLTGLLNRRRFDEEFAALLERAEETIAHAVAIIDIDHFKRYNDTYGHAAGDKVIQAVGDRIRGALNRKGDRGYRIGGEEFLVLCSGRTPSDLTSHVDTIREDVAALGLPHSGNDGYGKITLSVGLGVFFGPQDVDPIFEAVDQALYRSKREGRNRLTMVNL
ncbi:MAG: diguanylate cyclase domain-containing protein [Magnetovibrionaceae bacterium]